MMKGKKTTVHFAALALLAILVYQVALRAGADDAQAAVSLLFFRGQHQGDRVLLEWATATEFDTAYFFLERAEAEGGPYQVLDEIGIVPSEAPPDGLSGAEYARQDSDNVFSGKVYWYVLVEVESTQGTENRTQPIRVALGDSQTPSTATPTATPTTQAGQATATPSAGSPTATAQATTVSLAAAGATATASAGRSVGTRPASPTASSLPSTGGQPSNDGQPTGGGQPTAQAADVGPNGNGQQSNVAQAAAQTTTPTTSYPGPVFESPSGEAASTRNGYPPPPTPEIFATRPYPAPVGPNLQINGSPAPSIGSGVATIDAGRPNGPSTASNSPQMGTLFLWLGFGAALIVFVSAMAGAIYYYSKRRGNSG